MCTVCFYFDNSSKDVVKVVLDHKLIHKADSDPTEPRVTGSEWTWRLCRCVYTLVRYV